MDNLNSASAFQTPIFEIRAGSSGEFFYAHAGILARSEVLQKSVAGWASEARDRRLVWPEWSEDIVDKFLQWLYTGDYTIPYPKAVRQTFQEETAEAQTPQVDGIERIEEAVVDDGGFPVATQEAVVDDGSFPAAIQEDEWNRTVEDSSPANAYQASFATTNALEPDEEGPLSPLESLTWQGSHAIQKTTQAEKFAIWTQENLLSTTESWDYEATFMSHATLYVIACQTELYELKNMAWQQLRSLLVVVGAPTSEGPIIANIVNLIQYAYKETGISELPVDPLRDLLTSYVTIHFTEFKGSEVDDLFSSPRADDREFVVEVVAKVRQTMKKLQSSSSTKGKGKKKKAKAGFLF